jgi:hypothetical protein
MHRFPASRTKKFCYFWEKFCRFKKIMPKHPIRLFIFKVKIFIFICKISAINLSFPLSFYIFGRTFCHLAIANIIQMLVLVTLRRSTSVTHLLGINGRSKEQGPGGRKRGVRVVWYEHKNRYTVHTLESKTEGSDTG